MGSRKKRPTLQRRLAALTALTVAAAVVILSVISWVLLRIQLMDENESALREAATRVVTKGDPLRLTSAPPWARPDVDTLFGVVRTDGSAVRPGFQTDTLPVSGDDIAVAKGTELDHLRSITVDDERYLMLTIRSHGRAVQVARDLSGTTETLDRFAVVLLGADAVVVALAVTLGYVVTRAGLRPVQQVRRAAEHVARTQDFDAAVPIDARDPSEVASVAASVNAMLRALASSRDAQRQLVDDAGHELATPLTSLRTNIDLLLRAEKRPDRITAEDRAKLLADLHAQTGELTTLITEIVDLARDPRSIEAAESLDVAEVVDAAVARARTRSPEVDFTVRTASATVLGAPTALERAVLNLLDNAAKFGEGAPVDVRIEPTETDVEVIVADRGPGVPAAERTRVFERFHRSASARALPGSGLGLAIVAQIAAAHDGEVWLADRPGGGTEAHLRLPLLDQRPDIRDNMAL